MARAQKFGTFGGVFVPSLLTILGVIMYLRLGWVVGNAGLVGTIGIILIAHIISITTGLSVSSIATDKKVKAGGIYYMLSRSLGLPIGGAIGVALFVATALSISMYIVGFGESFNSAIGLSEIGMDPVDRVNNLRITGTITLVIVTTLALVSTSLAIKAQYYILGAIVLSIISIVVGGLVMDHGLSTESIAVFAMEGAASMETVFAIFFPAVTGFTAGVAMSGDLKDPKKSIPVGTMASIAVGLVVYIGLAIFLSLTIDSQSLAEDTNILAKIALFSAYGAPFLMAGIWGATLSSALGGILGGPRILQAMSIDQITPRIFGKGVGKSNEPRNALLFAFVIAEAGILIGELDLIAPIVSMFYLTAYGFINLTSALESWSGSDFRPTFKIPKAVSLIGAIATFTVMFKLDMIAMFASFIVIGIIFLYLTKKQINLGFSDVWQGVWSEVVRTALFKMSQTVPDKRSWRPNIILFSGSTDKRPHLLEYGSRLVGRLGLLSNFDLVEEKGAKVLFAKREHTIDSTLSGKGVFTRQYSCSDVYSGIERIVETYGFSGLDPNTILLGWARYSKHPVRFSQLINKFQQLDYSLLVMDYDQEAGFGKRKRIDIWWEGKGRHLSFVLTISRFLNTSDDWQDATVRLYIVADTSRVDDMMIYKTLDHVQEDLRVQLEVKIINGALEQRSFYEIVRSESATADLVYLELPDLKSEEESTFFRKTDQLCKEVGTVILYKGSSNFETIDLGIGKKELEYPAEEVLETSYESVPITNLSALELPSKTVFADNFRALDVTISDLTMEYYQKVLVPYANSNVQLIESIQGLVSETHTGLIQSINSINGDLFHSINQSQKELLKPLLQLLDDFRTNQLEAQEHTLHSAIDQLTTRMDEIITKCPPQLMADYERDTISDEAYANLNWKQKLKTRIAGDVLYYEFDFQKFTNLHLNYYLNKAMLDIQKQINQHSEQFNSDIRKYIRRVIAGLQSMKTSSNETIGTQLPKEMTEIGHRFEDLKKKEVRQVNAYRDFILNENQLKLQQFSREVDSLGINKEVKIQSRSKRKWSLLPAQTEDAVAAWGFNQSLEFNVNHLEIMLLIISSDLENCLKELTHEMINLPRKKILQDMDHLITALQRIEVQCKNGKYPKISTTHEIADFSGLTEKINDFVVSSEEIVEKLPDKTLVPNPRNAERDAAEEVDSIEISPEAVVNYLIQSKLMAPLQAQTGQIHTVLSRADHVISDVLQVVSLSLDSLDSKVESEDISLNVINTVNEEISRLQEGKRAVEELINENINSLVENFKQVSQDLNAHGIIKSALDFDYYLMTQKQTQVLNKFTAYSQNTKNYILAGLTNLYYQRSEGLIAAKRFQKHKSDFGNWVNRVTRMMNEITPDIKVLEDLPFYYKQLFLRPHSVGKELWLVRNQDITDADDSITQYQRIKSGGILILGAPLSGKTYLAEFIAQRYADTEKCFQINPPEAGSINVALFERSIKKSLKYYGDLESAFDHLEAGSVVIFNDVEEWWERSEKGLSVIEALVKLVNEHGEKCLFIINMNLQSFQLINNIQKIEETFFKTIKIRPFSAEEIKKVILLRHQTTRLKFEIEGKHEDGLSEWKQAKLFTKYFDISHGNIGVALQQWISNIQDVSADGLIEIRSPKPPDSEVLNSIDKDRAIVLIQFILHRRLSRERLQRILQVELPELNEQLEVLHRMDFLSEKNEILEINRFLLPFLTTAFEEDLMI